MVFGRKRNHDDMQEDNDVGDDEENTDNNESAAQTQTQTNDGKPLLSEVVMVSTGSRGVRGLRRKVSNAEQVGVSKALKNSVISKKQSIFSTKKPIEQSFGTMERNSFDLKIMRGLCANGIPFNVLRNPQFQEMVVAINKAPAGYKAPSSEKARTVLLDECARDVEKDLVPVKDTWYTQGVSIVSDGWSNQSHRKR
ncbi:hypothetical protein Tco_0687434 [Tanacetum coccineum]